MTGGKKPYTYQWYADGEKIEGATEPTLLVTLAMLGAELSVSVTAEDAQVVYSDETAAVTYNYPEIVDVAQKAADSFTITFDSDASEIVTADDIEVISEDETDVKKITGLTFEGDTALVTVNTPFKDGVLYDVNYGDSSDFFVASVGEVASIVISTTQAEINTPTKIDFALYDENGKDVTSAVDVDAHCTVTFTGDYNDYSNTKASNTTVTMVTKDAECEVTVEYNKNDGTTEPVTQIGKITCVAASEKSGNKFFKMVTPTDAETNNTSGAFRFYAFTADDMVKVEVDKTQLVHFYAQDPTDKSAISYDSYEIKSADETIANATIGQANGKWASFTVAGNQTGSVQLTITATKNGASTEYTIPVTVTKKAVVAKVKLSFADSNGNTTGMSNTWDTEYEGAFAMEVIDSNGDTANPETYNSEGFKLVTDKKTIDSDLKKAGYEAYQTAYEANIAGFRFTDAAEGTVSAYAAEGGSYTVEGSVSDLTTGNIINGRLTVSVTELPKEAWIVNPDAAGVKYYGPAAFATDGANPPKDTITGLVEEEHKAIQVISEKDYEKLDAKTTKPGYLLNRHDNAATRTEVTLAEAYDTDAEVSQVVTKKLAPTKYALVTIDANGDGVVLTADTLKAAVADDAKTNNKEVKKVTAVIELDADGKIAKADLADSAKATVVTLGSSDLFKVAPDYANKLTLGKDAYEATAGKEAFTTSLEKGSDAVYAVEMATSMGYAENNDKTAKLYATMNGTFAGYVRENGQIGGDAANKPHVLATLGSRIHTTANEYQAQAHDIQIQAYFAKEVVGKTAADSKISLLYGLCEGAREKAAKEGTAANKVLSREFLTTRTPEAGEIPYFYTNQLEQIQADKWFAREGNYRVEITYWVVNSNKKQEKITNFKVKNDLYVPTVTVKSQTLESYTQEDWAEAVVSEVDLNNNDPTTYSVKDLTDKNGETIGDDKTPAKWAVVTEEGVNFWIPLNRTFKLA